jgi:hypothetical protein
MRHDMDRPQADPIWSLLQLDQNITSDLFRSRLKQIVSIHTVQFEKLLFEQGTLQPELIQLFEAAGATYLQLAKELESRHGQTADPSVPILNSSLKPES